MPLDSSQIKIALMDAFPDFKAPGFDIVSYNERFHNANMIIKARSRQVGFPEHWGGLSIKCAFGGYEYYESGNEFYTVNGSNYLIFNEGKFYSSFIDSKSDVESFTINFTPSLERQAFHTITSSAGDLLDSPDKTSSSKFRFEEKISRHDGVISPIIHDLKRLSDEWGRNHGFIQEYLVILLEKMIRRDVESRNGQTLRALRPSTRSELTRRLHLAKDYLDANYVTSVSLEDLADVACLNSFYFLRQFKLLFGTTPHHYLQQQRLSQAVAMLRQDHQSVSEICKSVGFTDPTSFGKLFRRYYEQSAGEFRSMCARHRRPATGNR
jgi:AraC family transcriptional regulator